MWMALNSGCARQAQDGINISGAEVILRGNNLNVCREHEQRRARCEAKAGYAGRYCAGIRRRHGPNENKISDGYRERAPIGVEVF